MAPTPPAVSRPLPHLERAPQLPPHARTFSPRVDLIMEVGSPRALWTAVFLLACGRLSAFNLDTGDVVRKDGEAGSLFGFSLAMHRQLQPVDKRILLVGAPTAKGLAGQKSKVTGGLYNCDVTSASRGCSRVMFDNNEDTGTESKENQWMGVIVKSQGPGGKILTCAHRYQRRKKDVDSRDIIGRCYVLSESLTIDPRVPEEGKDWHFCAGRPKTHEMFGSCQQGMSATFDKDYHYYIFGAPGAYNWKGVVRLEQNNMTLLTMGVYSDGPFETGDENLKDPEMVPAPPNSFLGFSLDSSKALTKMGQLTVVAGAPRANHSGAVVLLKKGDDTTKALLEEFTLQGEGLASSFGYDLTVLDLNGDKWLDIVVGAPQYFEKDGEIGGAVYVYVNKAGKWNQVTPIRIDGTKDSMFGQAVENLGDINQDGFEDFAVGAPYENEGAGAVFVYHGGANGLHSKTTLGVRQFGYSLAGNMDLDRNAYPDLAVGSLSDSVFVFKARPVISIKKEIKFSPKEIDLTKKNCGSGVCLEVEACFTYTANPKDYGPSLSKPIHLVLINVLTVFLGLSSSEIQLEETTHNVIFIRKEKCIKRQLEIQENIQDKLHGIPIDVSVDIKGSGRKRRQSSSSVTPVLNANEPSTIRSEVQFLKEGCGSDNVCRSNLKVMYRYGYMITDDTFTPLQLEGDTPVISLSEQKDIALEVKVSNLNGDDAHEASVVALFPRALSYSAYSVADGGQVTCKANKNGSRADCELGNPFKRNSEATFYIILGTSRISLDTTELEIDLQLETTSNQDNIAPVKAKAKVLITLQLSVLGQAEPSQVYFSGKVKGEAAMKQESDIGSAITHNFRIINLGKRLKDFGTATLDIHWPKEVASGKWLLYLMNISSTGVDMECSPKTCGKQVITVSSFLCRQTCLEGAKCVTIKCPLRGLDSNAVITLKSRLWDSTFIEDYSSLHRVEVIVKASLHVDTTSKNTVLTNAETQVKLTVFPERVEARSGGVPWWIIVLSILFALLLLALLAFLLWKCGVFGKKNKEDPSEREKLTGNA
uniref:Integrin, alpha 6b n=1 Tax=Gasterosteus aculeatus aculeatus TaxID=481459 RepID=A0AAQ4S1U9_GASAC